MSALSYAPAMIIMKRPMRWPAFILIFCSVAAFAAAPMPALPPEEEFATAIRPILEKNCFQCHNSEKHKGDLNLAAFETYDDIVSVPDVWVTAAERVQAFEMPPKGKGELSFEQNRKLTVFFRALPRPDETDCTKLASDRNATFYRGYVMSRRINRAEYENTIRDLFGVKIAVADLLPADGGGGEGFDTAGNALFTSTIHIEEYMAAADRVLQTIFPEKGKSSPEIKTARAKLLLGKESPSRKQAREHAQKILARFEHLAFRR